MAQEDIALNLKASIDTSVVERDIQSWATQEKILQNTGIERDGGITNLYTEFDSSSQYAETFYCSNGKTVRLSLDSINDTYRVIAGSRDIGQVPRWAVSRRVAIPVDANDIMATLSGTLLVLRITQSLATIEEIDASTYERIQIRSFSLPGTVSDGQFVRVKNPSWATVTSIIGIFANGAVLNHIIVLDSGVTYLPTGQAGFLDGTQVFGYYERGWIVCAQSLANSQVYTFTSAGVQGGTIYVASMLTANYSIGAGTVTLNAWRDPIAAGAPLTTYGYTFTPPAALLGAWTVASLTDGSLATLATRQWTFGGMMIAYGASLSATFYNQSTPRNWATGHSVLPEIYGQLDTGALVKFKVHTILGAASYLSASFDADGIGEPITEIGELASLYYPQILQMTSGDYAVVYRRGDNSFGLVTISKSASVVRLQEVAPGVVKVNTTSALCLADANTNDLKMAGNAYNGFIIVGFSGGTPSAKAYVARHRGSYGGSVDTNYKNAGSMGNVALIVVPEGIQYSPNNETIDVYIGAPPASLTYYRSIQGSIAQLTKTSLTGILYVDDQVIPPPAGTVIGDRVYDLVKSIAIRQLDYDGYQLGNETPGLYDAFVLFSQLYLFDGQWILSAALSTGNVLQSISRVAVARGLVFLAEAPTVAYFLSDFDNSLYTYDGGQTVAKLERFSRKQAILGAIYSVRENTLAMWTDDSVLFIRDGGLISQITLPFTAPFRVFSTSDSIWFSKGAYSIRYLYDKLNVVIPIIADTVDGGIWGTAYTDTIDGGVWGTPYADILDGGSWFSGGASILPLTWQSKYNGYSDRTHQIFDRIVIRLYQEDLDETDLTLTFRYSTETGQFSEVRNYTIGDLLNPWDSEGYAYIEYIPSEKRSIGASVELTCATKIVYLDAIATVGQAGTTVVKNRGV